MPNLFIIRIERRTALRKAKIAWVMHDFFTEEEPTRNCYEKSKRIHKFGVRLYKCEIIEERKV